MNMGSALLGSPHVPVPFQPCSHITNISSTPSEKQWLGKEVLVVLFLGSPNKVKYHKAVSVATFRLTGRCCLFNFEESLISPLAKKLLACGQRQTYFVCVGIFWWFPAIRFNPGSLRFRFVVGLVGEGSVLSPQAIFLAGYLRTAQMCDGFVCLVDVCLCCVDLFWVGTPPGYLCSGHQDEVSTWQPTFIKPTL